MTLLMSGGALAAFLALIYWMALPRQVPLKERYRDSVEREVFESDHPPRLL